MNANYMHPVIVHIPSGRAVIGLLSGGLQIIPRLGLAFGRLGAETKGVNDGSGRYSYTGDTE